MVDVAVHVPQQQLRVKVLVAEFPIQRVPQALLGDQVTGLAMCQRNVRVDCFATPEEFRDHFKTCYGPVVSAYRGIAGDPERVAALDHALTDLARRHDRGMTSTIMDWEYLLLTARRRS